MSKVTTVRPEIHSPWLMKMSWCDLLFAHWPVDPNTIRKLLPIGLNLDLFDGCAYVGAVPFTMQGVTLRGVPAVRGLHSFPELNLRTYVEVDGKPGVWFFSLDAGQKLAVRVARRFFYLPYFDAKFNIDITPNDTHYSAHRTHTDAPGAEFRANYRPVGPVYRAEEGTLESWLTNRYCLYSANANGQLFRGDIDHLEWPLQPASAELEVNTLGEWLGIEMKGKPQLLHFAKKLDVKAWHVRAIE